MRYPPLPLMQLFTTVYASTLLLDELHVVHAAFQAQQQEGRGSSPVGAWTKLYARCLLLCRQRALLPRMSAM